MPTLLIALASALLLAALVTETASRFWPDNWLALLIISFIALFVNGLFNARLKQDTAPAKQGTRQRERRETDDGPRRKDNRRDRPADDRRAKNRPANDRPGKDRSANERPAQDKQRAPDKKPAGDKPASDKAPARDREPTRDSQEENAKRGPLETGTVKWFNRSKGYGFIIRDNGDEVFVHQRSIVNEGDRKQRPVLRDGQKVSFVVAHLEKGAQAEQVTGLD